MIINWVSVNTAQCIAHCGWVILPPDTEIKMDLEAIELGMLWNELIWLRIRRSDGLL